MVQYLCVDVSYFATLGSTGFVWEWDVWFGLQGASYITMLNLVALSENAGAQKLRVWKMRCWMPHPIGKGWVWPLKTFHWSWHVIMLNLALLQYHPKTTLTLDQVIHTPSCRTHQPLPSNQILLKSENKRMDRQADRHWDRLYLSRLGGVNLINEQTEMVALSNDFIRDNKTP